MIATRKCTTGVDAIEALLCAYLDADDKCEWPVLVVESEGGQRVILIPLKFEAVAFTAFQARMIAAGLTNEFGRDDVPADARSTGYGFAGMLLHIAGIAEPVS